MRKIYILPSSLVFGITLTQVIGFTSCINKQETEYPNILWIVADDLGTDISSYGETNVFTPNLQKLAEEGIQYNNLFTVAAVSSVSRSSLITGMYPTSIGCHQHRTQYKKELADSIKPITEYFRNAGYYVCNGDVKSRNKLGKTDYNFVHSVETLYDGADWSGRRKGQPFFAQIQISLPHRPFVADTIHPVNPEKLSIPPYYPDCQLTRKDWALYLETIQAVDREVGIILERLKNEGLAENTIVFFFGDQGQPHLRAKQFMYEEGTHTPLIIRWPGKIEAGKQCNDLISSIDIPAQSLAMARIPLPSHIHGQTFIDTKKREYIYSTRDRRDETVDRIRAVRSKEFRYIRNFYPDRPYTQFNAYKKFNYPVLTLLQVLYQKGKLTPVQKLFMANKRPKEELYNIEEDPFELNNLADNIEYESILSNMRLELDHWLWKYDLAEYPEDEKEIAYATSFMQNEYKKWMEGEGLTVQISDVDFLQWWLRKLDVNTKK